MWLKLNGKRKGRPAARWIESVTVVTSALKDEVMERSSWRKIYYMYVVC